MDVSPSGHGSISPHLLLFLNSGTCSSWGRPPIEFDLFIRWEVAVLLL